MIAQILIEDGPSWAPYAVAIGTCATAMIALVTAIVAVTSIKQNHGDAIRKHRLESDNARQTRAHNYLERYNAREQIEPRVSLYDFFVIDKDQVEDRISEWENTSYQTKLTLAQGLNFWEELSGMYNRERNAPCAARPTAPRPARSFSRSRQHNRARLTNTPDASATTRGGSNLNRRRRVSFSPAPTPARRRSGLDDRDAADVRTDQAQKA